MANTPPEIDKHDTIKNGALQQWHTLCCAKRCPKDIFAKDN